MNNQIWHGQENDGKFHLELEGKYELDCSKLYITGQAALL
jgi:hypothetical protein